MSARPEPQEVAAPAAVSAQPTGGHDRGAPLPTATVCIATYQRREAVLRLLESLGHELQDDPALAEGLDVVVVVDGSTDGTAAALREVELPVPLHVVEQPNRGLASARNAGWRAARGTVVWFLDDDLVPEAGVLARHRRSHGAAGEERVLVGPCLIPAAADTTVGAREWWERRYADVEASGGVRFDHFSAANTSLPRALLEQVGGFDERFVGYGREDYELGLRLVDAGVRVDFDAEARAVHHQSRTPAEGCRLRREEGRNVVRFTRLHPDRRAEILRAPRPPRVLVLLLRALRPGLLLLLAPVVDAALRRLAGGGQGGTASRVLPQLCFVTGVLEEDREADVVAALLWRAAARAG